MTGSGRDLALARLSPAVRARTVLAAASWLSWRAGTAGDRAPYVDQDGTPLLVVEPATADELLSCGEVAIESDALPELGLVRLGGSVWPAVNGGELAARCRVRRDHPGCDHCRGSLRTRLIGVRVDAVALVTGGVWVAVDPDAYVDASPDPVITRGLRIRAHLNHEHAEELMVLASRLFGIPRAELAGVAVDWIDALGLELAVVDGTGASAVRLPFRTPASSIDDLGERLHTLLRDAL